MSTIKVPKSEGASLSARPSDGDLRPGSHVVKFYAADESLIDSLNRLIGSALIAGDAAVVIATDEHRKKLVQHLKDRGFDISGAVERGRFISLDADETLSKFMLEGWPDHARFAAMIDGIVTKAKRSAVSENPRVVAFGEMVNLLWSQGKYEAAIQLEHLWSDAIKTHSFSLLCAYPITAFDHEEHLKPFLEICKYHSAVIPDDSYTTLTNEDERFRSITNLQRRAQSLETEVAERKKAQLALRKREAELADLLENALEGVQRSDPDQKIIWANKAVLNLLGFAADEYVGHHLSEFFVHSEALAEFWSRLMRREEIYNYAAELKCKDGSIKHVLINSNGLWEDERFVHTRTFIHDLTHRIEMEQALKQAHDQLEMRVMQRTAEINEKNAQLRNQREALALTNEALRELSARLFQVQDEERRRIARDLHDSTGQALALLSMNLSLLETEVGASNPELAKAVSDNVAMVRQISTELRTLSYLLHPPMLDEIGLKSALRWYIDGFAQRSSIKVELELADGFGRLPRGMEIALFRIIQECLTNIHRHSGASAARIQLRCSDGSVTLTVKDEGNGITPDRLSKITSFRGAGVGIRGMQERVKNLGGELAISSGDSGTEIKVVIPLSAHAPETHGALKAGK